jgi:hypothetical protein
MKYTRFFLLILILCAISSDFASAETPDPCAIIPEKITDLLPPDFNKPLRWKRTYGIEGEDKLATIVPLLDQGFISVGLSSPVEKPIGNTGELKAKANELYLNRIDKTGKLVWQKRHKIDGLIRIADALVIKDTIIIAGDIKRGNQSSIILFSIDGLGNKLKNDVISSAKSSMSVYSILQVEGGKDVIIAATSNNQTKIIRRSLAGKTIFEKEFLVDMPSQIHSLTRAKNGMIYAVGRAQIRNNKMGGWLLRLNTKGDLIDSYLFPRGQQSELNTLQILENNDVIVAGDVIGSQSIGGVSRAAWVMRLNQNFEPIWQDYIRGSYHYHAQSSLLLSDGRTQILLNANAIDGKDNAGRDHARIVTYTPEGLMNDVESFIEASNAEAFALKQSGDTRVIAGKAQTGFSNAAKDSLAYEATYDVWLAGLPMPKSNPSSCGNVSSSSIVLDD